MNALVVVPTIGSDTRIGAKRTGFSRYTLRYSDCGKFAVGIQYLYKGAL